CRACVRVSSSVSVGPTSFLVAARTMEQPGLLARSCEHLERTAERNPGAGSHHTGCPCQTMDHCVCPVAARLPWGFGRKSAFVETDRTGIVSPTKASCMISF